METKKLLKSRKGSVAIDAVALIFASALVIAAAFHIFPVFMEKQQLDTYASELCRTAEISGRVGTETSERSKELTDNTGLTPKITWSQTGNIQLGGKVTVTCTTTADIGLWGNLSRIPVKISSQASGKSEVYWK
ncbi:MAG TPA: hypothetical protein DIV41_05505 [Ruminococcaceae bacterium]|nr:hypothetical protein [Oscillospiraceae bacterium]